MTVGVGGPLLHSRNHQSETQMSEYEGSGGFYASAHGSMDSVNPGEYQTHQPQFTAPSAYAPPLQATDRANNNYESADEDEDRGSSNKRKRASAHQIATLDEAFSMNPNPDSATRKMLAVRCGMTPRSVQIWFQNRRARIRLAERNGAIINPNDTAAITVINTISKRGRKQGTYYPKKNGSEGGDSPKASGASLPRKSAPKYKPTPAVLGAANPAVANAGLIPTPPNNFSPHQAGPSGGSYDFNPTTAAGPATGPGPAPSEQATKLHTIPIDTLLWGTWRRTLTPMTHSWSAIPDLQMHMDAFHRAIYITITSGGGNFRIEISFDSVTSITVEDRHYSSGDQGADMVVTAVTFGLAPIPPRFFMQLTPQPDWLQCSDFTENSQGTSVPVFTVLAGGGTDGVGANSGGYESEVMKAALADVVTGDKWLSGCIVTPESAAGAPPVQPPMAPMSQQQHGHYSQGTYDQQQQLPAPSQHQQQQQAGGYDGGGYGAPYGYQQSGPADGLAGLTASASFDNPPVQGYQQLPMMGGAVDNGYPTTLQPLQSLQQQQQHQQPLQPTYSYQQGYSQQQQQRPQQPLGQQLPYPPAHQQADSGLYQSQSQQPQAQQHHDILTSLGLGAASQRQPGGHAGYDHSNLQQGSAFSQGGQQEFEGQSAH